MIKKFIVLDVEGMSGKPCYNLGYIVADRYGNIYEKRNFVFLFNIQGSFEGAVKISEQTASALHMTKSNMWDILADTVKPQNERKYTQTTIDEFFTIFIGDITRYNIKRIFSYNCSFDKNSTNCLLGDSRFSQLEVTWCDIISGILTTKLLTKKYIQWCKTNNFLTPTGIASYKAEIVYRYLTNDLTFQEEHTGLEDVLIEYDILMYAYKSKKKLNFEPICAWRKLKEKQKKLGL